MPVVRPFYEPDLRDDLRLDPHHLGHLLRRDASAPMRSFAVRQVDKRALPRLQWLERVENFAPKMRREPCSHLPGEAQLLSFVVAHEQRVDAVWSRTIAANHELLLLIEL